MPLTAILAINVKDPAYGAVGDGATDDTTAIQLAIDAAVNYFSDGTSTPYLAAGPTLYFPAGEYKISSTLMLGDQQGAISIVADNAVLSPVNEAMTDYAMVHSYSYHVKIDGLNFRKFKKGLRISNRDYLDRQADSSNTVISRCTFQRSEEALLIDMESANVIVEHCKFTDNDVSINIVRSDKTILTNSWISSKTGMTGLHPACIINGGRLLMESFLLIPYPPDSIGCIEPAWINNYACVTVKNNRQGNEPGSFTLINNFAGVGDARGLIGDIDPCSVTVQDSICYGVYNYQNANYEQPAVVRYVTKIPNITCVENNWGMTVSKIIGFSQYNYNDDANAINAMIAASGIAVNTSNVSVSVEKNVGGRLHPNGSHVPSELFPYVRSKDSLWPLTFTNALPIIDANIQPDHSIIFRFEYEGDFFGGSNTSYLINYSGNPVATGSVAYRGGYIGILKSNGFWSNPGNTGIAREALVLQDIFNQIGDKDPGSWPTGTFTVEPYWDETGDRFLSSDSTNKIICLKISGRSDSGSLPPGVLDHIKITPLDSL